MKGIFKCSFEESKRIVLPKNRLFYLNEGTETHTTLMNILRSDLRFRLIGVGVFLEFLINFIYRGKIKIFLLVLIGIIYTFGLVMMLFLRRKHYKNWVSMKKGVLVGLLIILFSIYIVILPVIIKLTLVFSGYQSLYLQLIILIMWTTSRYIELKSVITKRKSKINKYLSKLMIALLILCIIVSLQYNGEQIDNWLISFFGKIYFLLLSGAIVWAIFKYVRIYLSYYYIDKYSRQYRLYYRIPDSVWYFSKEEAEKRNDPVYPPRRKKVSEEEQC